jgi:RND family efflux transporter MFP subunit
MRKFIIAAICIILLATAIAANIIIVMTAPKAEKKRPPKITALVETQTLEASNETVLLELTGTVTPAEEVMLRAQVAGEIISMDPDFIEGGMLGKDADILTIDPVDYELALAAAKSALVKAQFDLKLELGRQDVAKREWELLKTEDASETEKELALRIPHLAASKAALEAAEAALEKAEINLRRTRILAPFNAVVINRNVNIGSQASLQDVLAKIVGTDAYWVVVSIPLDRLRWVTIPGSTAKVISNGGAVREGRVIKLLGDLEEKGRMARLLVEMQDPLCLLPENAGKKPLLLGEYVRTEIRGSELENVYAIPRKALHENKYIWIAANGKLDIREVDVLWRDARQTLIRDGIAGGELLIVSDLTTPIQGMDVNTGSNTAN